MNNRIVILEGCTKSGKSIVKVEVEKLNLTSEYIYTEDLYIKAFVERKMSGKSEEELKQLLIDLESFIKKVNPVFVLVDCKESIIENRLLNYEDIFIDKSAISKKRGFYISIFNSLRENFPKNFIIVKNEMDRDIRTCVSDIRYFLQQKS